MCTHTLLPLTQLRTPAELITTAKAIYPIHPQISY